MRPKKLRRQRKRKMKLNKEQLEKIIFGIIICIIIIIVLVTLVFAPSLKSIKELRIKIVEEKNKVVKAEKEVSNLSSAKSNLNKLKEQVKQYSLNMPEATPDWLLERLNSIAGETAINFDKIEPKGNILQIDSYWMQGLYLELKTDYHRLGAFINKLENLSPFIKILDLSITGNKDDVNKHIVKLTVGAYVYENK